MVDTFHTHHQHSHADHHLPSKVAESSWGKTVISMGLGRVLSMVIVISTATHPLKTSLTQDFSHSGISLLLFPS